MASDRSGMPSTQVFEQWLESLKTRDPKLYAELRARAETQMQTESVLESTMESAGGAPMDLVLETIVRDGRPAVPVRENLISAVDGTFDAASKEIVDRLTAAADKINPVIPLVGRIDVENYAGSLQYVGTGWLITENFVATNRHVANLIARQQSGKYVFLPGRFGDPLRVNIDYRHELNVKAKAPAKVMRVVWIQPDNAKADFALLEVARRTDGTFQKYVELAANDAGANDDVAVIGYPARAPKEIIPDQERMDRIYGGAYDVKRVAPGMMGSLSAQGWATHDCTTLGGNSGSVVVSMRTGEAVALHFAGLYMIENYAVPVSILKNFLKEQPWRSLGTIDTKKPDKKKPKPEEPATQPATQKPAQTVVQTTAASSSGEVTITIPLTIKVSLGQPVTNQQQATDTAQATDKRPEGADPVREAARALLEEIRGGGVLAVHAGYVIEGNKLTDEDCLVVAAHPEKLDDVLAKAPETYRGYPVEVRAASLNDQSGEGVLDIAQEAVTSIRYNDDDRTGEGFSFDWVEEEMDVTLHVGPERGWKVLRPFLDGTDAELVSSIYEFHAAHIAGALEQELDDGAKLTLVMAPQSRDPKSGNLGEDDFSRSATFEDWANRFDQKFLRVFVPTGSQGLVALSYHIKVTVRDGKSFWLSSGNWKQTSQPNIPADKLDQPKSMSKFNREWHVVMHNETIAQRYRNHILADYDQSLALGGSLESIEEQVMVDVPMTVLEGVTLEAAPSRVVEPLEISRRVRVKPLLTPDKKGKVYTDAVLKMIRSAEEQLLFQNQYIKVTENSTGFFEQLVEAVIEKSNEIDDVRIILRAENDGFWDEVSELKRRGMDVNRCVRRLPKTHTKGIIVDGKQVLVGSHNWSMLGVTLNRDASLLFDDEEIAQYYREVFELDWKRAGEIEVEEAVFEERARIADPEAPPPPGYVRMSLSDYLEG